MNTKIVRAFALVAAFGVAACGDDDPVTTGDALSEAEVAAISNIVLGSAFTATANGLGGAPAAVNGPQAVPFSYTGDVETTVPCTGGGSVQLNGSATISGDDETEEYMMAFSVDQVFSECTEFAEQTEQEFTISGTLALVSNADFSGGVEAAVFSTDTELSGSISWTSDDGRSGTCGVSLVSEASSNGQQISASTTGSVCGTSVSETFTYGIPTT